MALAAIDSIREAELNAQKQIDAAVSDAQIAELSAKKKADGIITDAVEKTQTLTDHKSDKAYALAEEIIISAKNSALLDAEKLRSESAEKQDKINSRIMEIII